MNLYQTRQHCYIQTLNQPKNDTNHIIPNNFTIGKKNICQNILSELLFYTAKRNYPMYI